MESSTDLFLQDRQHWIQIWRRWWPKVFWPKKFEIVFALDLYHSGCAKGCSILLKFNSFISSGFPQPRNSFILQHLLINMLAILAPSLKTKCFFRFFIVILPTPLPKQNLCPLNKICCSTSTESLFFNQMQQF